jgi:hypothetical protein
MTKLTIGVHMFSVSGVEKIIFSCLNIDYLKSSNLKDNAGRCHSINTEVEIKDSFIVQGEHKRTLHFQNDTENKCGMLRTSRLHQSIEKHSKVLFQMTWVIVVARLR